MVNQSDVTNPPAAALPLSGSHEQGMDYVWCTPGTKTYTFFALRFLTPPPIPYYNFTLAVQAALVSLSNQADMKIPYGAYTNNPAGYNTQIHVENSGGGELTYGILNSALTGLSQFQNTYQNPGPITAPNNDPIIFQVNDGQWGEVGRGYIGYSYANGVCVMQIYQGEEELCSNLDKVIA